MTSGEFCSEAFCNISKYPATKSGGAPNISKVSINGGSNSSTPHYIKVEWKVKILNITFLHFVILGSKSSAKRQNIDGWIKRVVNLITGFSFLSIEFSKGIGFSSVN